MLLQKQALSIHITSEKKNIEGVGHCWSSMELRYNWLSADQMCF